MSNTFVKIVNGKVGRYPYTIKDLRQEYLNTSFPQVMSNEVLATFNVYPVTILPDPVFNARTQKLVPQPPALIDGVWTVDKNVVEKTQEEIDSEAEHRATNIRNQRDRLLQRSDFSQLPDATVDKEAWAVYRDQLRNIPQQEGFPWDVTFPTKPE